MKDLKKDPFEEYLLQTEGNKTEKSYTWQTAIGLQEVDGLKPSDYLKKTAIRHIEGEITLSHAEELINSYYEETNEIPSQERVEEADKVSLRIATILSEKAFDFSPAYYISIHKRLFEGIYPHAGKLREYNITKKEWVLDGETVIYGSAYSLRETLEYDFSEERKFKYQGLSVDEFISHIAFFIARLWQIHIFAEGNTRTTAVFLIKYLRSFGYAITNDAFAKNAWYFRNALVRANYNNFQGNTHESMQYLELFLRNLLLNENNPLHNRDMHISGLLHFEEKPNDETKKPNDKTKKPNDEQKTELYLDKIELTEHTKQNIQKCYEAFGKEKSFGRKEMMEVLGLKKVATSELIKKMLNFSLIISVHGKGKYKFNV